MTCDPNTLSNLSKCLRCLTEAQLLVVRSYLMCQWAKKLTDVAPNAPTNPDITDASFAPLIFVTWTNPAPQGSTNEVWKSSDGITFALFTTVSGGATSASDATGLNGAGQFAYYKIRSCNGSSCSAFSPIVSAVNAYTSPNVASISFPTLVQAFGAAFTASGLAALTSVSLPKLRRVVNTLNLSANPALTTVNLNSLVRVDFGSLFLGADNITGALSLPALTTVGTDLQFQSNPLLTSFSAPLLTVVAGNLVGHLNNLMASITFTSLNNIGVGFYFDTNPALTTMSFPALVSVGGDVLFNACTALLSVSFPVLSTLININLDDLDGNGCTLLSALSIPQIIFTNNTVDFTGAALNAASINQILARGVASGVTAETFNLTGGTNAAPSGQGIVDKATLITAGNNVNTN
jgi:hypothetical protein